jgi:hypothetical protein
MENGRRPEETPQRERAERALKQRQTGAGWHPLWLAGPKTPAPEPKPAPAPEGTGPQRERMAEMAVKKGARSPRNSSMAAGTETAVTGARRDQAPQQSGRTLSPSEHVVLQAIIAEAMAMRRRLTAGEW